MTESGNKIGLRFRSLAGAFAILWLALAQPASAQYTINGAQKFQTIDGFGANINHRGWNGDELKPVLDTMINQGGMTLFRVVFDNSDWVPVNNFNQSYLNSIYGSARFEKLWDTVGYLNQKGITNGVMFNFMGPGASWMGTSKLTSGLEPQWAQLISSLIVYARNSRHLQFYLVGPDNEPDSSTLNGIGVNGPSQYVTMLDLLAQNLNSNGLSDIRFVAPDLTSGGNNTGYMGPMLSDSLIMSKLARFGLHSYITGGGGSSGISNYIASSSHPGTGFWMTEFNNWCPTCFTGVPATYDWNFASTTAQNLLYDLANGSSAGMAWEGFDSVYELLPLAYLNSSQTSYQAAGWSFYGLFAVNSTNASPKIYTPRKSFYTMSQISAFVPPGSQRIGVSGTQNSSFMMLAFYHPASGRVTITGFNNGNQASVPITLQSLPSVAGFDFYYTDANTNLNHSAFYPTSNGTFTATIPASCIFTLTGFDPAKIAVSVQVTNPANGAYYTAPANITLQATATSSAGAITNVEFYANGNDLGGDPNPPYSLTWGGVRAGTFGLTAVATDTAGNTNVSPVVTVSVAGPAAQIMVASTDVTTITPTNATVIPDGRQQFTASVVDSQGIPLMPQPTITWSVSGGGTMDPSGWFTAGDDLGGPFTVLATNGGISGVASITISSNLNLAPNGIGYVWYNLTTNTSAAQQYESPGINDGDTNTGVSLLPCCEGSGDFSGDYEAAGVVWAAPQTICSVTYINSGSVAGVVGTFDSGFQLQFSYDGATWVPAGPQWTLSPAYNYNSSASSPVPYVFSGSLATVMGVRCVGKVNTGQNTSTKAYATEVQAYSGAPPQLQASGLSGNGLMISWDDYPTNCVLETTTNHIPPFTWTTVTNAWQTNGGTINVAVPAPAQVQYFRLRFP